MQVIEKVSAVQQVEDVIKKYILSEDVNIGDKLLSEKLLCEKMNVGRGTVREAIRLLQAKGYLDVVPGRGAFVVTKEEIGSQNLAKWFCENEIEIKDLIEVRMAIEPLAVKLAIQRCSYKTIQKLKDIHARSEIAVLNNNVGDIAICDEKFHTVIIENSNNKLLISINKQLNKNLAKFRGNTFRISSNVQNFIPAHLAILDAFEKRDVELGEKMMISHLKCVYDDLENSKNIT